MTDVISYLHESANVLERTAEYVQLEHIQRAVAAITSAIEHQRAVLVCGNGGSASDAMHITGELVGRFRRDRRALKAICLCSNPAVLTAWANDYSYETVFSRQIEAYGQAGGVLIALSTSGNSPNVVHAFETARQLGIFTIALTGEGGGKLAPLSDVLLDVPTRSTPLVQQIHICLYHFLCDKVEAHFAP